MTQIVFDEAAAKAVEGMYLTPDVVAQRARVLDLLAVRAGEAVLDIGCGPGLLAYDLARLAGETGHMVALDSAAAMVAMTAKRLEGMKHAEAVEGQATKFAFPDGAFDAAVATQVYEYVADMPRALAELHRVLKPGGRTLILDTDWRSIVWHSSDKARMERILKVWDDHLVDPHLPATVGPLLKDAGFIVRRVVIVPMLSPDYQPATYAAGMMRMISNYARTNAARHGLEAKELQDWWDDQQQLIAQGRFFFSVNRYAFLATR
jgi:ubiquinone/menaquinone biosynthesis C-methylase UbiE